METINEMISRAWRTGGRIAVTALAFSALANSVAMAQWTQWGGPNQSFKVDSKGLADKWPDDGPKKLWTRDLGEGYSAVLAENDRLYTMYRDDKREVVICMDAKTGDTIWEYKFKSTPAEGHATQFGTGPRSTPLIAGDRIYAIGMSGKMHCLNKEDGKKYWSVNLWKKYKGNILNHGYSSSPIEYKDSIIVLVGGEDQSIMALDKLTGKVKWKQLSYKNSYSTPKIINLKGEDHMVTFMANEIVGFNPNNGHYMWSYEIGNQWKQNICMPVIDDDILFLSTSGAGSRGLKLTKNGDKIDAKEVWTSRKVQFYHVNSIKVGDYVYGSSGSRAPNFFSAVNIKSGKIAWRERGFALATCVYADGKFIILDEDGMLGLATATPEGFTVLSKVQILDKVAWSVPTLVGKTLIIRDKTKIMALDLG